MTPYDDMSDAEILKAAGLPAPEVAAPVAAPLSQYDHMSDDDILKAAGISKTDAAPAPSGPAQMGGILREPALVGSNVVKGATESIPSTLDFLFGEKPRDPTDPDAFARAKQDNLVNVARGLDDPMTDDQINAQIQGSRAKSMPMTKAVDSALTSTGIANRPDLQPQGTGEELLAAGSQGVGAALPFALAGGAPAAAMNLARGGASGIGAELGHDAAPNSEVAPLVGGLLGGMTPDALGGLARGGVSLGRNALGAYDPSDRANAIIAKKLTSDSVDPATITQTIADNPNKPLTIADLAGPATQRMARASLDVPSDGSAAATQMLQDRDAGTGVNGPYDMFKQGGTADRVVDNIKSALGSDDAFKTSVDLMAKQQQDAGPLYDAFRAQPPVPARQVQTFMSSPTFKQAVSRANTSILDEGGEPLTNLIQFNDAGDPVSVKGAAFPPDTLDRIKQGLDDSWLSAKASGDGGAARTANTLRSRFLQFMDTKYPDTYPQARQAFAGPAVSLDALKQGAEIFNTAPEDVASTLQGLPAESQPMFRIGVQRALIAKVQNTADGANEVRALLGNPAKRASIAAAFDNPDALNQLSQNLGLENRMFQTKGLLGGSRTAPSLADQVDMAMPGLGHLGEAGAHAAGGNYMGAAMRLVAPMVNRFREGANSETMGILAQRLLSSDPQQNAQTMELVRALMGHAPQPPTLAAPTNEMLLGPLMQPTGQ